MVLSLHHAVGFQVSRRLANMGYVIWICAMAMSFISFCIVGDSFRVRMGVELPELITAMNLTQLPGLPVLKKTDFRKADFEFVIVQPII